jgi:hypothetical protein
MTSIDNDHDGMKIEDKITSSKYEKKQKILSWEFLSGFTEYKIT